AYMQQYPIPPHLCQIQFVFANITKKPIIFVIGDLMRSNVQPEWNPHFASTYTRPEETATNTLQSKRLAHLVKQNNPTFVGLNFRWRRGRDSNRRTWDS